jgi:hypothetical protein
VSDPPAAAPAPPWHVLLAPLPEQADVIRKPVGTPELLATEHGAAIAGWEQVSVTLSAGTHGLRNLLVVLDATGTLISASDGLLRRFADRSMTGPPAAGARAWMVHESVGGRFEADGRFGGTHWRSMGEEPLDDEEPAWDSVSRAPTSDEAAALAALAAELLRRAPG